MEQTQQSPSININEIEKGFFIEIANDEVKPSIFDNDVSLRLRYATILKIPSDFLELIENDTKTFQPIPYLMLNDINDGVPMNEIQTKYNLSEDNLIYFNILMKFRQFGVTSVNNLNKTQLEDLLQLLLPIRQLNKAQLISQLNESRRNVINLIDIDLDNFEILDNDILVLEDLKPVSHSPFNIESLVYEINFSIDFFNLVNNSNNIITTSNNNTLKNNSNNNNTFNNNTLNNNNNSNNNNNNINNNISNNNNNNNNNNNTLNNNTSNDDTGEEEEKMYREVGIDLYANAKLNENVPLLFYRRRGNTRYYKIYQNEMIKETNEETMSESTDTKSIDIGIGETNNKLKVLRSYLSIVPEEDEIVIVYSLTKNTRDITRREGYEIGRINMKTRTMTLPVDLNYGISDKEIIERILDVFPKIKIDKTVIKKVSGNINFYNFDKEEGFVINDVSFLDMILNDRIMGIYLKVEETQIPVSDRKRLNLQYKSLRSIDKDSKYITSEAYSTGKSSVSTLMSYYNVGENDGDFANETYTIINEDNGEIQNIELERGEDYLRLNIIRGISLNEVNTFIDIFSRLYRYYINNREDYDRIYRNVMGDMIDRNDSLILRPKGRRRLDKDSRLKDVFVSGYAKFCQAPQQPEPLNEDEIPNIKSQTFDIGRGVTNRQILYYPNEDEPEFYFYCPNDEYPFPAIRRNLTLSNKEQYPFLPCCYKEPHLNVVNTERYVDNIGSGKPLKSNKILPEGRYGELSLTLTSFCESLHYTKFYRLGVNNGVNSLLSALLIITGDENYTKLKLLNERDDYLQSSRLKFFQNKSFNLSILASTLYDLSNEQRINYLLSNNFLDSKYVLPALEQIFNCNLLILEQTDTLNIELPRSAVVLPKRLNPNLPTYVLFKTFGSDSQPSIYPSYEIIVGLVDPMSDDFIKTEIPINSRITFNWLSVSQYQQILDLLNPCYLWFTNNGIQYNYNLFNIISQIIPYAKYQYLDQLGFSRALIFEFNIENKVITGAVSFPPLHPFNLPVTSIYDPLPSISVSDLISLPFELSSPSSFSYKSSEVSDGLWFPLQKILSGLFIKLDSFKKDTFLIPQGPLNPIEPISSQSSSSIKRLTKIKRDLSLIRQLLQLAYSLTSNLSVSQFFNLYVRYTSTSITDSSLYYDFSSLSRFIPSLSNINDFFSYYSFLSTFIDSSTFLIYNNNLYNKLLQDLTKNSYNHKKSSLLTGFYQSIFDFSSSQSDLIFISESQFNLWLSSISSSSTLPSSSSSRLFTSLSSRFSNFDSPYLYFDSSLGLIFLVFNAVLGPNSINHALNISEKWNLENINYGLDISHTRSSLPPNPIYIYNLNTQGNLELLQSINPTSKLLPFYLLRYLESRFASLLPLKTFVTS